MNGLSMFYFWDKAEPREENDGVHFRKVVLKRPTMVDILQSPLKFRKH